MRQHVDRPAGPAQQCGFDEVVAEDMAAEGLAALQFGKPARLGKGFRADDGVVAPVISVAAMPGRKTGGDHRTIHTAGELRHAGVRRPAVAQQRQRLDDAGLRIGRHGAGESDQQLAAHLAVGVEHDHVVIGAAPAPHEVGDVAGLAVMIVGAAAVVDAHFALQGVTQRLEARLSFHGHLVLARVAQDENVEVPLRALPDKAAAHALERGEHRLRGSHYRQASAARCGPWPVGPPAECRASRCAAA